MNAERPSPLRVRLAVAEARAAIARFALDLEQAGAVGWHRKDAVDKLRQDLDRI
ncbi:hypothetical protein [uncultured Aeromicrobium sp.]|uniref:hypothetical protein n=1 Tax=uncultured Aeromicrobium sp. TaxID=337820 RepID=UPI0025F99EA9|nr:hypothetical protein [uncultured Aeromicrobium sp.]